MTNPIALWAGEKTNVRDALKRAGFKVDVAEDGLQRTIMLAARDKVRNVIVGRPPSSGRPCSAFWLFKEAAAGLSAEEFVEALLIQNEAGASSE